MANKTYVILLLITLSSCGHRTYTPQEYMRYVTDVKSGCVVEKTVGGLTFKMNYLPPYYWLFDNALRNKQSINRELVREQLPDFEKTFCFRLEIKCEETDPLKYKVLGEEDYRNRISYFSFGISQDFVLLIGEKEISCTHVQFENYNGAAPFLRLMLFFHTEDSGVLKQSPNQYTHDLIIRYEDRVWQNGRIKFLFDQTQLNQIPNPNI